MFIITGLTLVEDLRLNNDSANACTVNLALMPVPGFAQHSTYLGPEFGGSRYSIPDMTPDTPFEI